MYSNIISNLWFVQWCTDLSVSVKICNSVHDVSTNKPILF